jgi:hypothetical protein
MNHTNLSKKTLLTGVGLAAALCTAAFGPAPANDDCSTAEVAILGVPASFDTTNATASPEAVNQDQCADSFPGWGPSDPDVWFRWTPTESGNVTISTCDAASFDTTIVIYTGTCGNLTQIGCNGDGSGETGCQGFYSNFTLNAVAGTTYYIRIGGYTGDDGVSDTGAGTLSITVPTTWQYQCLDPAPGVTNDCAPNATTISADGTVSYYGRSASGVNCNTDGPPHLGELCASGSDDLFLDRWYRVTAAATGSLIVWTTGGQPECANTADLKLAVYDMGTNPAAFDYNSLPNVLVTCNDDGGPCAEAPFYGSQVTATVQLGRTYLVRVGYFNGDDVLDTEPQVVNFDLPATCPLQSFSVAEDEPCGENTNGGCNTDAAFPPVQTVNMGDVIGGTYFSSSTARDTDWYQFSVNSPMQVTASVNSRVPGAVLIVDASCVPGTTGPGGTPGAVLAQSDATAFCPVAASVCLNPGTYRVVVVPAFQDLPCGATVNQNDYRLSITGVPASCPILLQPTCSVPGPDSRQLSVPAAPTGNFVQACATGCGNLSGGSADVSFAIKIEGANLLDEIRCVQFGAAALRSVTPTGGTCGFGGTDRLIPCKVGFYRDINGGNPTNFIVTQGDGGDLELIESFDVLVPSGVAMASFNIPQPLCVPNESNLVFVFQTPNLFNGTVPGVPANAGYRAGIGVGVVTGQPSNVFSLASLCGDTQFGPIGANSYQWPVIVNGTEVGCSSNCPADLNGDNFVNGDDLGILLGAWGQCASSTCPADFNDDGFVNGDDLGVMLGAWGACPG